MKCECDKEECIKDFNEYFIEGNDDFDYIHCEVKDCHNQYYKCKNGWNCNNCDKQLCEGCCGEKSNGSFLIDDEFYCTDCLKDLIDDKLVIKCQNIKKYCDNYVFCDDSDLKCNKCKKLFCSDCCDEVFKSKKFKDICCNCLIKLKK